MVQDDLFYNGESMMKKLSKVLALMFVAALAFCFWGSIGIKAEEKVGKPKFTIKYINQKTGIKITIPKVKGAEAYYIHIKSSGTKYDGYKDDETRIPVDLSLEGTTYFTIDGLTKGTYKISVGAVKIQVLEEDDDVWEEVAVSKTKKVKIKAAKKEVNKKSYDYSDKKVGDTIVFGAYEQNGIMTDGKEDIEWIVLSKSDKEMLVMSKYAIEALPYHIDDVNVTWADCSLRKWLNNAFYKEAFTKAERSMIKTTKLANPDNEKFETSGGKTTKDKVFILSMNEALNPDYGFNTNLDLDDSLRCPESTQYVWNQHTAFIDGNMIALYTWLRTPGAYNRSAAVVAPYGYIMDYGIGVMSNIVSVRPVITIKIE